MKGEFSLEKEIVWKISVRARRIRIAVLPGGKILVTRPKRTPLFVAKLFVRRKKEWIERSVEKMKKVPAPIGKVEQRREFKVKNKMALAFVNGRLPELNKQYGFIYKKIAIRNQKTRWGSCSKSGNLSFNYRILSLSPEVADYLMVHELCHLREMNHSRAFWDLVARAIPDYKKLRKQLRLFAK
jgi:predicted metal-dependent hydrolase